MHVGYTSAPPKRNHPLIEPWARERLASNRIHQNTINRLGLTTVPLGFQCKEKFGMKR